jgi:transcriptional regulator with XRE-family HTH domain
MVKNQPPSVIFFHYAGEKGMQIVISPAQSRAARALLDARLDEVAQTAGVGINTLARFEKAQRGKVSLDTAMKIADAYKTLGIEFLEGGVRVRQEAA